MDTTSLSPVYVPAGNGHFVDLGDHRGHVKVAAQQTQGNFMLFEMVADFNGGVPPHVHYREDETFVILSGHVEFQVGEQIIEVGAGDTLFAPRNIPHTWRCTSPEGARVLIFFTPGDNFQAFGMAMAAANAVPKEAMANPALASDFMALCSSYGIEMLPAIK